MWNNLAKIFLKKGVFFYVITATLLWYYIMPRPVSAANEVVFTHPAKSLEVFEVETEQIIGGYIKDDITSLDSVEISFDGQIWRNVTPIAGENQGYYYWQYRWTVAGEGRSFILIRAKKTDNQMLEGRILIEVYVPPEKKSTETIHDLLNKIREENKSIINENKSDEPLQGTGYFGMFEYIIEGQLGSFIAERWMVFLPTIEQQQFLLDSLWQMNSFIRKYPAGIDLLFFMTLPYMILLCLAALIAILYHFYDIKEKAMYLLSKFIRQKESIFRLKGYLIDVDTGELINYARISLRSPGKSYSVITNDCGCFEINDIADGEFSYEIFKNGFKQYMIDEHDTSHYRHIPVITDKFSVSNGNNHKIVLGAERIVSKKRKIKILKAEYYYPLIRWFWQNINPIFTVGLIFGLVWLFFTDYILINYYLVLLAIFYFVYRFSIRIPRPWGRVYDIGGKLYDHNQIKLWQNGNICATSWTDWKGRFIFSDISPGMYIIEIPELDYKAELEIDHAVISGRKPLHIVIDKS